MKTFDELWKFCIQRSASFPVVQEYEELRHVFNLMQGGESYLEVGTAEGNSLYILAHALKPGAHITYIDLGEKHTTPHRDQVVKMLSDEGYHISGVLRNSNDPASPRYLERSNYDFVMIDAGHTGFEVLADAILYAWRARVHCFFHDICIPDVNKSFQWYANYIGQVPSTFVNSNSFGYGILSK